jgi:hypothetical protein
MPCDLANPAVIRLHQKPDRASAEIARLVLLAALATAALVVLIATLAR